MRYVSVRSGEAPYAALLEGERLVPLGFEDVGAMLRAGGLGSPAPVGESVALGEAALAPVVPAPPRIFCVGLNYRTHIIEMRRELPAHPTLFAKFPAALVGPRDDSCLPALSEQVDWEAELAVIVGRRGRHLTRDEALEAIAGYSVINDVTARDFQNRTLQWLQGKTFEGTCPFGPALVTPDEIDHARDLEVTCEVDGEVVQRARTSDLLFDPPELVAYISQLMTLEPGDVIATGTPGGVGAGMDPPRYLKDGSVVRTRIEGIGELVNVCVAEASAARP